MNLLGLLTTAGPITKSVALNLKRNDYTVYYDGAATDTRYAMSHLTDALVYERTKRWMCDDRAVLNDRNYTTKARQEASERQALRTQITETLTALDRETRVLIIDHLADGRGALLDEALTEGFRLYATSIIDGARDERAYATPSAS